MTSSDMAFMRAIQAIYGIVIEALFPLSAAEKELFRLTPIEALSVLPRAPAPPIPDAHSVFAYKDERVSKMIWNIKYKKSAQATSIAAYALYEMLKKIEAGVPKAQNPRPILVIPMPITPRRRRERGYNQCELLADELEKLDTDASAATKTIDILSIRKDLLMRVHHASRQTLKNRADRLESAKGIFSVNESAAIDLDRPIIIIDDVITTGSTMKEAMETMRAAGFKDVHGLSIAH